MLKISKLLLITAILGAAGQYAEAAGIETDLPAMLAQLSPAVVSIRTVVSGITTSDALDDPNIRKILGIPEDVLIIQSGVTATGSGVIVDRENGYIVTNSHLIANADDISVTLADGKVYQAGRVGEDAPTDLAVVKIDAPSLSALNWGRSSELRVGDFVVAVGSPFGLAQTATFGIVSGLGRSGLGSDDYEDYIQTDAAINPGSSGGALVTPSGALIGITRGVPALSEASAGIGFAIPSDIAAHIVRQLIAHGEYRRGWLGLSVVVAEHDDGGGTGEAQGLVVNELMCNFAAERQGVRLGDVIMALDGRALATVTAFRNAISLLPANSRISLDIRRGEELQKLDLVVSDRNDDPRHSTSTGFLESVTIGFPSTANSRACAPTGPVLLDVGPGSIAHSVGLRTGDYLTAINGEALSSPDRVREILEDSDGKVSVDVLRAGAAHRIEVE